MASKNVSAPLRSAISQLNRLSITQDVTSKTLTRTLATSTNIASSITTSSPPPSLTTSVPPVTSNIPSPSTTPSPFGPQHILATHYSFPSLEPLRLQSYAANQLHLPTRRDILHRAVIYEGDKTRLGTASTKWRSDVHGSARKIRPQKGSGRARLGDKKSPMLRGGGVAFGPKPRDFSTKLPKKVYDLAWRTALSYRYRKGELVIIDNEIEIDSKHTGYLTKLLDRYGWGNAGGRSLFVTETEREKLFETLSEGTMGRHGEAGTWEDVDVKDLLSMGRIVVERRALDNILQNHSSDLGR